MTINIYLPTLFGYSVFFEVLNNPVPGKLLDWECGIADTEIWIARKIHIIVSNEKYYSSRRT